MNLIDRAKNIMFNPKQEWEVVKAESITISEMYTKYAAILIAIPALAGLIGYTAFGIPWVFGTIKIPAGTALTWAIIKYVTLFAGVVIMSFVIDALAPSFGSAKDLVASTKVAVFSSTPSWVGGIFFIIPAISFLAAIAGIYSLVLMYIGLQKVKDTPPDKIVVYFIVIIVAAIIVFYLLNLLVMKAAFGPYLLDTL